MIIFSYKIFVLLKYLTLWFYQFLELAIIGCICVFDGTKNIKLRISSMY